MNKKFYISFFFSLFLLFCSSVDARQTSSNLDDVLFNNDQITISALYPNPAVSVATFKYSLHNPNAKAKIIVRSILGQVVGEYNLDAQQQTLKIEVESFVSGMYFYTLSVDEKHLVTRKFLVKK